MNKQKTYSPLNQNDKNNYSYYDPTLHLAQELIQVINSNNSVVGKVTSKGIITKLPLTKQQYQTVKHNEPFWR